LGGNAAQTDDRNDLLGAASPSKPPQAKALKQ
jgi:hypothetical protein